jgi:hypothetical protein
MLAIARKVTFSDSMLATQDESPPNSTQGYVPFSGAGFNEIDLYGDNSMYVHVFDEDLSAGPWEAGNTILLQPVYTGPYGDNLPYSFDFSTPPSILTDTMLTSWGEPKSLRWYDAGECAERVSWREFVWRMEDWFRFNFTDTLEQATFIDCNGDNYGNQSFSIILDEDPNDDRFRYSYTWTPEEGCSLVLGCGPLGETFCEDNCNIASDDVEDGDTVKITFTGAIRASSGVLTFVLESIDEVSVNNTPSAKLLLAAENPVCGIEATFNRILPEMFAWRVDRTGFTELSCVQGADDSTCADQVQADFDAEFGISAATVGLSNGLCLAETWQTLALDGNAGECAFVPSVARVNYTPGWLELVYTEEAAENFEVAYLTQEPEFAAATGSLCFGGPEDTDDVDPSGPFEVQVLGGGGYMLLGGGSWAPYFEPVACVYAEPLFNDNVCL